MKINVENDGKIINLLTEKQNGASVRKITRYDIECIVKNANLKMARMGLPKQLRNGTVIVMDTHCEYSKSSGQKKSSGTIVKLLHGSSNWFLTFCERTEEWCYDGDYSIQLPDNAKKYLVEQYSNSLHSMTI